MKEITGELWDYYGKEDTIILITTNGTIKKNGELVMGRGCAFEATKRFPKIAKELGSFIQTNGNEICAYECSKLWTFPVKHNWWEMGDLLLIAKSAEHLKNAAEANPHNIFVLPRPGCSNGRLSWDIVKPILEYLPDNVWVISR